jgi:hypothetical protein
MSPASVVPMFEASLLDDARFLEELAKIDALPTEDTRVFQKPVPTLAERAQPTAIADELPRTLGPHTKGPQFILAQPPSKRRSSGFRSSSRSAARARTAVVEEVPAAATENIAATASDSSSAASDEQGSTPLVQLAEKNPDTEAILSAFPSESARAAANNNTERKRASDPRRSAPIHPALAVVGFVLMMSVGAGVAALVSRVRNPLCTEGGDAPGWQGAKSENTGSI